MASWDGERALQLTRSEQQRAHAALEPGRQVSRRSSPRAARTTSRSRSGCSIARGGEASPLTGFNGDVVDYEWSPDGQRLALIVADEDPRRKKKGERGQDAAADRHRPLLLQGRRDRLPRHAAPAFICVRRREPQSGDPDAGPLRRRLARVVARRQADRVLQQARRRSGPQQRVRAVRHRSAARRDAAAGHELPGRQRRRVLR